MLLQPPAITNFPPPPAPCHWGCPSSQQRYWSSRTHIVAMTNAIDIPFIPPEAEKLLLWRDVKKSGIVFGGVTGVYLAALLNPYPLITVVCYLVAVLTFATLIWAQLGALVSKNGPPVPAIFSTGVSEADARKYVEEVRPSVNEVLAFVGALASGKDLRLSLLVIFCSYIAARVFVLVSPLTLVFIAVLLAFTLPKAYEMKKTEVDKALGTAKAKADELYAKVNDAVLSKIPKAATKKAQ